LHQTTPVVHAHDFRFGSHCILCGVLVGNVSAASMDPVAVEIGQELVWACGPQGRLVTIAIGGFLLLFAAIPLFLGIQAITTRHAHFVRSGSFHEPRGIDAIIAGVPVVALGIVLILGGFFLIFLPVFMKSRR
jgi:type IV secretory pathway VirB3-like protein